MGNQKFEHPIQPILDTYHIKKEFQKIKFNQINLKTLK